MSRPTYWRESIAGAALGILAGLALEVIFLPAIASALELAGYGWR